MLNKKPRNKEIYYSVLLIVVPITILFTAVIISKPDIKNFVGHHEEIEEVLAPEIIDTFSDVSLTGKAAIVKDLNTGEYLYSKNKDLPLPLASITKILTALTAEMNSRHNIIGISPRALSTEGNSGLFPGEQFYKQDLINLTLISSSNDGATALALDTFNVASDPQKRFIDEMNSVARKIGMNNSYFYNETGLDNDINIAGAHGSAEDIALLLEYVLVNYPEILEFTKENTLYIRSISGLIHPAKNTNDIVGELPNTLASKTGYTDIAGGNLAVVIDPIMNNPIAIVVLGSTEQGRFDDVSKLAETAMEYFKVNYNSDK